MANSNVERRAEVPFDELDAWVGLIQPEMVSVPDGHYTHRVVTDGPIIAGPVPEHSLPDCTPIAHHVEPLDQPIPRYKKELRWVNTL